MNSKKNPIPPIYMLEDGRERIVAPFYQAGDLALDIVSLHGTQARLVRNWDCVQLRWDDCPANEPALGFTWVGLAAIAPYRTICFCLQAAESVALQVEVMVDGVWQCAHQEMGTGRRQEIWLPVNGQSLDRMRLTCIPREGGRQIVTLYWLGLAMEAGQAGQPKSLRRYDPAWPGLIVPEAEWPEQPAFARGLLFRADDLPALRERRQAEGWSTLWAELEVVAEKALSHAPEARIGRSIPWSDGRYQRSWEVDADTWFGTPLVLAVVGLVNEDRRMIQMALRYLMCFVHTPHWCVPEAIRIGAFWTQRCFLEEMATTHVALLADWLHFALTRYARELVRDKLWDTGLAVIERDMMKYDYMWTMNQGAWFCRARILGGLLLEKSRPRTGDYVDRAARDMHEILSNYVLPDGGTDEGVGYFSQTMHTVLMGVEAYARARGTSPAAWLPEQVSQSDHYLAMMSSSRPGHVLVEGDNSYDKPLGCTVAALARIFPGTVYERMLGATLTGALPDTYYSQYLEGGAVTFLMGPDIILPPQCVVPMFGILVHAGHLTSLRDGVRIHLNGAKAHASHMHLDKGSLLLECHGKPVLIDRGMVRYDDVNAMLFKATALHNTLTPVHADGTFPDQQLPTESVIPAGTGDAQYLAACIDLSHVWRDVMISCCRDIVSPEPQVVTITDSGELRHCAPLAFHLHALQQFAINGNEARLGGLRICADWAVRMEQRKDGFDYQRRPVWHLMIYSDVQRAFTLQTDIFIDTPKGKGTTEA